MQFKVSTLEVDEHILRKKYVDLHLWEPTKLPKYYLTVSKLLFQNATYIDGFHLK